MPAITIRGVRVAPTVYNFFPPVSTCLLGAIQIVCGIALFIISVLGMRHGLPEIIVFTGVPVAAFAIIAGAFGIAAGRHKTSCKIVTNMVMSIMAAAFSGELLVISADSLLVNANDEVKNLKAYMSQNDMYSYKMDGTDYQLGLLKALMFFSVAEAIVAILGSIIDCHFVCFCCQNSCHKFDVSSTEQFVVDSSEPILQEVIANERGYDCQQLQRLQQKSMP